DGSILPASQNSILHWVAHLGGRIEPKTIKAYLTHLRSMHTDIDLPFTATESPLVQRVIRGIKRYHGERGRNPKQPITLSVLTKLITHLRPATVPGDCDILAAACTTYAGFLRCGEFTVHNSEKFNPSINLTAGCLDLNPRKQPGWNPSHPLFRNAAGTSLDCSSFIKRIRQALQSAGFNQSAFSGHSFHHGAATSAFAAGFTEYEIQLLGRWRSNAYKLYIEIDEARRLHISSQLHWAHPHESLSFEPPALHSLPFMA
ncbi:hypothetical protein DFH05DRAFT_1387305, partial [Lentinula detonsa]